MSFIFLIVSFTGVVSAANLNITDGDRIQAVIDNSSTSPGDTITVFNGTYNENVVINKRINIVSGSNSTPSLFGSVTINSGGSGSRIQGLHLNGNINLNTVNCTIYNNTIVVEGYSGIIASNSFNNIISDNAITRTDYRCDGISSYSSANTIYGNTISGCEFGIWSEYSNNTITSNNIVNNQFGIWAYDSTDTINFNRITGNTYGLINEQGTINATNNWWGTSSGPVDNDINIWSGTVIYKPWIVDITPPTVTSFDPANNAVRVPANKVIKVTFSENVISGTNWVELKNTSNGALIPLTTSVSGNVLTVDPTSDLATGARYNLILHTGGVNDLAGNPLTLTGSYFTVFSIQDAVNNASNHDVIQVPGGNYTDKIVINKDLTLMAVPGENVTFRDSDPLITINSGINVSIHNITFTHAYAIVNEGNCTVTSCTFIENGLGILNYGNLTVINSTFTGNNINSDMMTIENVGNCTVTGSTFTVNNSTFGRVICNVGFAYINFNRIFGTGGPAIDNCNNGIVDANNNWWGSNNGPAASDIIIENGAVYCSSWLVLTFMNPGVIITQVDSLSIPVGLIINNYGEDTSSQGHLPDGIPINFATTMGTINSIALTGNGIASSILNFNTTTCNITVFLDNQTIVQNVFSSIQTAINDALDGSSILLAEGIYTENVVINKNITLAPVHMVNVTIQALNSSNPVITINSNGNGSIIRGLTIKGAMNSCGIYLNGTSNCCIISNNLTGNYNGISLLNSNDNTIVSNVLMNNQIGVCLEYSNNNTIQNNVIQDNYNGIYLDHSNNVVITENNLSNNVYGINSLYSSAAIHFNRITGNSIYGLFNQNSTINATNNWWGSNDGPTVSPSNGSDIYNNGGTVNSHLWLELNVNVSNTNSSGNTSITADLTHNNEGNDTSSGGHVPNGIPINFTTTFGTVTSTSYTVKGKATTILNLGSTQDATVTAIASLDNQIASTIGTIGTGLAVLTITSTAIDNSTSQPLNITYTLPLNNPVTWLSVLWKNTGTYSDELQVIVNGTVVIDRYFTNNAYNIWKNSYPQKVFNAISHIEMFVINNYIYPNLGTNTSTDTGGFLGPNFWSNIKSTYGLNTTELAFVQDQWYEFLDGLRVDITYPGVVSLNITVIDPEDGTIVPLDFTGTTIQRASLLQYHSLDGYEGVRSFAITTTKLDDDILNYWLNQYSLYQPGAMKAAYGTFLASLLMEYTYDQLADSIATQYNVTWSRTSPIIVSVCDDAYTTYMTLECDHSMGMTVVGTTSNVWSFNYICSFSISLIEQAVMEGIFKEVIIDEYGVVVKGDGVTTHILNTYLDNNTSVESFVQNGFLITKIVGNNHYFLLTDLETGLVRDVLHNVYGVYCFHDPLTQSAYELGEDLVDGARHLNMLKVTAYAFGTIAIVGGFLGVAGAVVAAPETGGISLAALFFGWTSMIGGAYDIKVASHEPWFTEHPNF